MKPLRLFEYFSQLRRLFGWRGAVRFSLSYMRYLLFSPKQGTLGRIPVGPYKFYFPDIQAFITSFREIFLNEFYYIEPTLKPITVIDCGANIGDSLLYIKVRAPHARVISFEPNPAARAVLEKNIETNNWKEDVQVYPYALASSAGTADFFVEEGIDTSGGASLSPFLRSKNITLLSYKVEVRRLSDFIKGNIDLLKIDIEGGEFEVLEDLIAADKMKELSRIQLEYHYNPEYFKRSLPELLGLLSKEGFQVFALPTVFPHNVVDRDIRRQYMIFAWRPENVYSADSSTT